MTQADHANAAPAREQPQDENKLIAECREKLKALRERQAAGGAVAFPNDFKPQDRAAALQAAHAAKRAMSCKRAKKSAPASPVA